MMAQREPPLSRREREVFDHMVCEAMSAKQTAVRMNISYRTVEFYARRIREKLKVNSIKLLMVKRKEEHHV